MLERVEKRLEKWINIDVDAIFFDILSNQELQRFMIQLNTKGQPTSQLFIDGIDSLNVSLGDYAPTTIEGTSSFEGKKQKGQPFDRITLEDTGRFYGTFAITLGGNAFLFKIAANPNRGNSNLFDDFVKDVVGWTEDNLQLIINAFKKEIFQAIKRQQAA